MNIKDINENELLNELEELDGLLDADVDIQGNNLLNLLQIKRKLKSRGKKNKHKDYKGVNKGKKEKLILDSAHERLLKREKKKK